jgi:hypothetical protein
MLNLRYAQAYMFKSPEGLKPIQWKQVAYGPAQLYTC